MANFTKARKKWAWPSHEAWRESGYARLRTALQRYGASRDSTPHKDDQLRFKTVATWLALSPYCWSVLRSYPSRPQMLVIGGMSVAGWATASPTHRQSSAHAQTKLVFIFVSQNGGFIVLPHAMVRALPSIIHGPWSPPPTFCIFSHCVIHRLLTSRDPFPDPGPG